MKTLCTVECYEVFFLQEGFSWNSMGRRNGTIGTDMDNKSQRAVIVLSAQTTTQGQRGVTAQSHDCSHLGVDWLTVLEATEQTLKSSPL